jgi:maltose alpha-D-glucosyltransferase/alpha-amylase
MRKECPEISWGTFVVLRTNVPEVLALRYDWRNTSMVTVHNFSNKKQKVVLKAGCSGDSTLVELFDGGHSRVRNDGGHQIEMDEYGWKWYRVGAADNVLDRSDLNILPTTQHV